MVFPWKSMIRRSKIGVGMNVFVMPLSGSTLALHQSEGRFSPMFSSLLGCFGQRSPIKFRQRAVTNEIQAKTSNQSACRNVSTHCNRYSSEICCQRYRGMTGGNALLPPIPGHGMGSAPASPIPAGNGGEEGIPYLVNSHALWRWTPHGGNLK